jgi:hypothetical protein
MIKIASTFFRLVSLFLFITFFLFPACNLAAQENIVLTGKVLDEETNAPLNFVSLSIAGMPIGTVTNADGEFDFNIPVKYASDTLIISMMGYKPFHVCVHDIKGSQNIMIRLEIRPIQLSEVVITDTKINAAEVITKAFENIENNFPIEPYVLNAFYRESHQENNKSVMLVEAALDIYDGDGYKAIRGDRSRMREKVMLRNVRASKSYRHSLFKNTAVERYNLVISALRCNAVKYRNPNIRKILRGRNFMLDSIVYSSDRPVYVISFLSYIRGYPNFERKNTLYIDAQNFAIHKFGWEEYAKEGKYSEKPRPLTKDSAFFSYRKRISTIYEFENFKGKMYLKYFDEKCYDDIYNAKEKSVQFESVGNTTLMVTEIKTETIAPGGEGLMQANKSIHQQVARYDPEWWRKHEQLVPLTKKQIDDLEWELPLEQQFQLNKQKQ